MINSTKSHSTWAHALLLTTVLAMAFSPPVKAAIFQDDFQSGELRGVWQSGPDGSLGAEGQEWKIVPDPDVATAVKHNVLCTPAMGTQLYLYHVEPKVTAGSGLLLSFRFNADEANDEWKTTWTLFAARILNGPFLVDGYSVRLEYSGKTNDRKPQVTIIRVDPEAGRGKFTELAAATLPVESYQPGWNTVSFLWKADGSLQVILNGKEAVSAKDTTYEPAFRTLGIVTWLANNLKPPETLPEGRKMYFDDVHVDVAD